MRSSPFSSRAIPTTHPVLSLGLALALGFVSVGEARADSGTCQALSDQYGIVAGKGFGMADGTTQSIWRSEGCNTQPNPSLTPVLCQQLSDRYGVVHGVTWGSGSIEEQGAWKAMGCHAVPSRSCQEYSDHYAVVAGQGFGMAGPGIQRYWKQQGCNTRPSAAVEDMLCQ